MNIKINGEYQPFIKWVGGKRGLLKQILGEFPREFNNYYEPFLGGGAVFFELYSQGLLKDKRVFLSDINEELINSYKVVKNSPKDLIINLELFKERHNKEFYYQIREMDREENFRELTDIERATRFIYLNKSCFNGLYRVNKKGYFNTPIGSYKNPNIADRDTILKASEALQNVELSTKSFNQIINCVTKGDLVYFDPPYYPLTTTSSFTSYNKNIFLDNEQKDLFNTFKILDSKECYIFHSNSNTDFIKNLYKEYDIITIQANRFINSKGSGRGKINEIFIRNVMKKSRFKELKNSFQESI